jgi:hypothetical protein
MPGESYNGELPPLTQKEIAWQTALQQDVEKLAGEIGRRNYLQTSDGESPRDSSEG